MDFDVVDASNLQRQIIHSTADIGRKKLDSAAEKLKALNPYLNVVKHDTLLSSANALDILKDYDVIADGTDNFPTRYVVNDACAAFEQAECIRIDLPFRGPEPASSPPRTARVTGACIPSRRRRALVPSCAEGGVLGVLPGPHRCNSSNRGHRSSFSAKARRSLGVCFL